MEEEAEFGALRVHLVHLSDVVEHVDVSGDGSQTVGLVETVLLLRLKIP